MRVTQAERGKIIVLGKRGENRAQQVLFDVSDWPSLYGGGGSFSLLADRDGDSAPYLVPFSVEDGVITWTVSNADTSAAGLGRCELQYYVSGAIAKSQTWRTRVIDAMGEAGDAPESYSSWVDEVLAAAQIVISAGESATASAESAAEGAESARMNADRAESALEGIRDALQEVGDSETIVLPLTEAVFREIVEEVL